ncbi:hypothetical protein HNV11_04805 [Spirosoma taeanense]|uniref:Uncharacterized protein n=1 Tax=Spirosoma taeanense TaxID=2735870 RepID=A0A6M5Y236_9BACT|nr:hypothetical protein [Spirosoma taeanense]QJW88747.1 hypothetical protein HNV11_04805 [Spirosoma taeanense]
MKSLVTKGLPWALLTCLIIYTLICLLVISDPKLHWPGWNWPDWKQLIMLSGPVHWPGWGRLVMLLSVVVAVLVALTFKQPADQYPASTGNEHITTEPSAFNKGLGQAWHIRPLAASIILLVVYSLVWFIELKAPINSIGQNFHHWTPLGRLVMLVGIGVAIKSLFT